MTLHVNKEFIVMSDPSPPSQALQNMQEATASATVTVVETVDTDEQVNTLRNNNR